jgi:hypothetical protein
MEDGRASFRGLLSLIDSHLRMNGEEARLPELERFWPAVYEPTRASADSALELDLILAQRQGFDVELLPFIEAAEAERLERRRSASASRRPRRS